MAMIRVTRTVLVEETIEYNSSVPLPIAEQVMESGESFERDVILIGREIEIRGIQAVLNNSEAPCIVNLERISEPQIIKIERI